MPTTTTVTGYTKAGADSQFRTANQVNTAVSTAVSTAIANLVGSAPPILDTIQELAAQMQSDESGAAAVLATQTAIRNATDTTWRAATATWLNTILTGSGVSYNSSTGVFTFSGGSGGGASTVDKFTVGIASSQAAIGTNVVPGGQLIDTTTTVTTVYLHADAAPVGSGLTVTATDAAGYLYFTQTIAAGATDQTTAAVSHIAIPAGTRLFFNITSAGTTTAAIGVVLDFVCDSSVTGSPATLGGLTVENWNGSTLPSGWATSGNKTAVLDGAGNLTFPWVSGDPSAGQDQFTSTLAKVLRTVTYNSDGNWLAQHVSSPMPKTDGLPYAGLYADIGSGSSGGSNRWVFAWTEHFSGTSATMYHKMVFWNGTSIVSGGPWVESSNTNFDTAGLFQRLSRSGTVLKFEVSADGSSWRTAGTVDMSTGAPAGGFTRAGIGSTHSTGSTSTSLVIDWTAFA